MIPDTKEQEMKIRNTSDDMTNPNNTMAFLTETMGPDGTSGAIQAMEARGQQELVHSDRLPVDTNDTDTDFEALGFVFGQTDENDPLFRPASLPQGWAKKPTDHDMWSEIVDAAGKRRVAIFYKAAFYDRRAHMDIVKEPS